MKNLKKPTWPSLKADLSGGLAGALVSIPQSMGLGIVAFAPLGGDYASFGLVAGLLGGIIVTTCSALFGGAPGLISGPRASVSLVFAAIIASLLAADLAFEPGADRAAITLSLAMVALIAAGLLQIAFGLFRLGDAIKFVPYPVIAGFLNAAAILIILGQLRVVFAGPVGEPIIELWRYADWDAVARAGLLVVTVLAIHGAAKVIPQIPGLLTGAAIGTGLFYLILTTGIAVDLGPTLPAMQTIQLDPRPVLDLIGLLAASGEAVLDATGAASFGGIRLNEHTLFVVLGILVPGAISIALLQSFDSLFSAVALDDLTQGRSDAKRELIAQGSGTVLGAGFGFLGGSGSMVRTMPCFLAGGRTAWSGLSSSIFMLAAVLLLAPFVERIPGIVVAGVLFAIAIELFDKWTLTLLKDLRTEELSAQRPVLVDLAIIGLVVGTAMAFGLVEAVGVGIAVAIAEFVLGLGRSPIRRSYRGDAVSSFLQRDGFSAALLSEHGGAIAVLELEGPYFFGSAGKIEREVDRLIETGVRHVILDFRRVSSIDSTAARSLARSYGRLGKQGKTLFISYLVPEPQRQPSDADDRMWRQPSAMRQNWQKLRQFGALNAIDGNHVFPDTDTAMRQCEMLLIDEIAKRGNPAVNAWQPMTDLFDGLDEEEATTIRSFAESCRFEAGSTIFEQGEPGDALYILMEGKIDVIIRHAATDRRVRINTMTKGAVFGEMAILDPKPRSATIVAMEDTTCYRITAEQLEDLNAQHPTLGLRLMKHMCLLFTTRVRMANLAIMELES